MDNGDKYRMDRVSAQDIAAERRHQQMSGYAAFHDDEHVSGELLLAAMAYLCIPGDQLWPWEPESFHPSDDPIDNLIVAGAFLAAEADRLKRCRLNDRPATGGFLVVGIDPEKMLAMREEAKEIIQEMTAMIKKKG